MIYLDNNATTLLDPAVAAAMLAAWQSGPLNPSSQHAAGRAARARLDQAAAELGQLLGADVQQPGGPQLVFTSGGTEANHLALSGLGDPQAPLIVSQIEHPSILEAARSWSKRGRAVHWIPVDSQGVADLGVLEQRLGQLAPQRAVVCLMSANNETGAVQPIDAAAPLCRQFHAHLHVDATQSVGKLAIDFTAWNIGSLAFAAHKFHGPVGIGGLLLAPAVDLRAAWQGGAQQLGMRPGTEAVPLAVGAAAALRIASDSLAATTASTARLRDQLEQQLCQRLPEIVVHARQAPRLPGTSCIGFPGIDRQSMLMSLDLAGVACSSGSACASGSSEPSYVLQAMQVPAATLDGSLRFGLSKFSTDEEIASAIELISLCYNRLSAFQNVEK